MSLEHQSQNPDLLTPEEAQQVIKLYAEREKKRREEAERLAAMPKLEDLSSLLNMPLDAVRELACKAQKSVNLPIELDDEGYERVNQKFADKIIELADQAEKAKQAEQERLARMASLKDVASGLGINENEAASLLKEVRQAMAPPIIDPRVEEARRKAELAKQTTYRQRMAVLLKILAILVILWILSYFAFRSAGIYYRSNRYDPWQSVVAAERPSPDRVVAQPDQPMLTVSPDVLSSYYPPDGWSIGFVAPGFAERQGVTIDPYKNDTATRLRLRDCLKNLARARQPYIQPPTFTALASCVPYAPLRNDLKVSDMPGWAILSLANKDKTKSIYFNLESLIVGDKAMQDDAKARLDWLLDGKISKSIPKNERLALKAQKLPRGLNLTIVGQGRCLRFVGSEELGRTATREEVKTQIEDSILEAADIANKNGIKFGGFRLVLCTDEWQNSFDFDSLVGTNMEEARAHIGNIAAFVDQAAVSSLRARK